MSSDPEVRPTHLTHTRHELQVAGITITCTRVTAEKVKLSSPGFGAETDSNHASGEGVSWEDAREDFFEDSFFEIEDLTESIRFRPANEGFWKGHTKNSARDFIARLTRELPNAMDAVKSELEALQPALPAAKNIPLVTGCASMGETPYASPD